MRGKQTKIFILILSVLAILNFILAGFTLAAESTITVSSTPFLAFTDIPDSLTMGTFPYTVPITDTHIVSDTNGPLPLTRALTIQDTRNNGGFILQVDANAFAPALTPDLRNNLKMITSGVSDLYSGETPVNGIVYLPADGETAFIGSQTVTAPINSSTTNFSDPATFSAISGNTLNTTIDLMDGCLTTGGRKGKMNEHVSFDILIPKYTLPPPSGDQYYSTITYTLSDYTPGTCP